MQYIKQRVSQIPAQGRYFSFCSCFCDFSLLDVWIMETKLIVPIAAKDLDTARQQVTAALGTGAEMLELRTDYLENLSVDLVKNLIAFVKSDSDKRLPISVTCRDKRQGGGNRLSAEIAS